MSRVLGFELRRSAALGAALILLVAGVVLLFATPGRWSAGWMPLAMTQREDLTLLVPLALAAGAWQGRREHRSRTGELFASTARPRAQRVIPTLGAMGIAVVAGYLMTLVAGGAWIIGTARFLPPATGAVVGVGALSLVAAACFGLAAGRLVPLLVTPPALAVAGIVLVLILPFIVGGRDWLALVFSPTISRFSDYQTVPGRVSAAQAIWLIALAITGTMLLGSGSRRARVAAVLPVALGATVAITIMPRGEYVASPVDPAAQHLVCAPGTPRVCVSRAHSGLSPEVIPLARQALTMLAKLPDGPVEADEDTTTFPPPTSPTPRAGAVLFPVLADKRGHLAWKQYVVSDIVTSGLTGTQHCTDGPDEVVIGAAAGWLMGREPVRDPRVTIDPDPTPATVALWQGLERLPEPEAAARVAAVHLASLRCESLDGLLTSAPR